MGRIGDYLQKYGIRKSDVPKAVLILKGLSYGTWFGMIALCYRYRPVQALFRMKRPQQLLNNIRGRYPGKYENWHGFIMNKSEKLARWKYFSWIPYNLGLHSKRFTIAIAEGTVSCKVLLPITLSLQFWATIHLLKHPKKDITIDEYMEGTKEVYDAEDEE